MTSQKQQDLDSVRERAYENSIRQGRVFSPSDLPGWDIDMVIVKTMVRSGRWRKLRYGVYTDRLILDGAMGDPREFHELNLSAAIHSLRSPAAAFGRSAASLHDLPLPGGEPRALEIIRDSGQDLRALHDRVRNPSALPNIHSKTIDFRHVDFEAIRGINCVSRDWAAVTAACRLPRNYQVGLMDAVLWQGRTTRENLDEICEKSLSLRGMHEVRRAIPLSCEGAQTILETISRLTFRDHSLPDPTLQERIYDSIGLIGIVDFAWLSLGVIGEADGAIKYDTPQSIIDERRREQRLKDAGFEVFRWTWSEIHNEPMKVVSRFNQAATSFRRAA
jgi:very-short-patch-repair endonuclease